jgi:hypothetical protein
MKKAPCDRDFLEARETNKGGEQSPPFLRGISGFQGAIDGVPLLLGERKRTQAALTYWTNA